MKKKNKKIYIKKSKRINKKQSNNQNSVDCFVEKMSFVK